MYCTWDGFDANNGWMLYLNWRCFALRQTLVMVKRLCYRTVRGLSEGPDAFPAFPDASEVKQDDLGFWCCLYTANFY